MLLDSYAWVEFFLGSQKGEKVKDILKSEKCYTSIVSVSEISEWCLKNELEPEYFIKIMEDLSTILILRKDIVALAGKVNFYNKRKIKGWGMLDSFIYSTAKIYGLNVLTGDKHFEDLDNSVML